MSTAFLFLFWLIANPVTADLKRRTIRHPPQLQAEQERPKLVCNDISDMSPKPADALHYKPSSAALL